MLYYSMKKTRILYFGLMLQIVQKSYLKQRVMHIIYNAWH